MGQGGFARGLRSAPVPAVRDRTGRGFGVRRLSRISASAASLESGDRRFVQFPRQWILQEGAKTRQSGRRILQKVAKIAGNRAGSTSSLLAATFFENLISIRIPPMGTKWWIQSPELFNPGEFVRFVSRGLAGLLPLLSDGLDSGLEFRISLSATTPPVLQFLTLGSTESEDMPKPAVGAMRAPPPIGGLRRTAISVPFEAGSERNSPPEDKGQSGRCLASQAMCDREPSIQTSCRSACLEGWRSRVERLPSYR